jgi:hypothetical protein
LWQKKSWGLCGKFRRCVGDREGEIETRLTVVAAAALGGSSVFHREALEVDSDLEILVVSISDANSANKTGQWKGVNRISSDVKSLDIDDTHQINLDT